MQPSPARPTPEALLEHLDWVRQLARSLVVDPNAADDLVQETWLSAARRPPQAGNLRGWLAQVVRNAARQRRRTEARRAVHEERAAKREATPSRESLADRVAAQQRLVQCVLELDEPYRETVLLRYFEELPPRGIAARLGVPVATVKTRLRRALAELRTRLDRANGGDGRAWMLALMPLAQAPGSLGTAGVGALLIMSTKTIALVAALLVLAGLGAFLLTRDAVEPEAVQVATRVDGESASAQLSQPPIAPATTLAESREDAPRAAAPDASLRVEVVDMAGTPVPGAEVWHAEVDWDVLYLRTTDREEYVLAHGKQQQETDVAGAAFLPAFERATVLVARTAGAYGERFYVPGAPAPVRIVLVPDVTLRVQVVDEDGATVNGARISVLALTPGSGQGYGHELVAALTQAPDGLATLRHLHQRAPELAKPRTWAVVRADVVLHPPLQAEFDPRSPPAEPLRLVLPRTGRVTVLLEDEQGRPLTADRESAGHVMLTPIVREHARGGRETRAERVVVLARGDRAEFAHVGIGLELQVEARMSREIPPLVARHAGPRTHGEEVVVTLRAKGSFPVLTGRLIDASGKPRGRENLSGRVRVEQAGQAVDESHLGGATDGDGRFRIPIETTLETETRCAVHVRVGEGVGDVLTADIIPPDPLRAGENAIGDVVLSAPAIALSGTVRDVSGKPVYWARVDFARDLGRQDGRPPFEWVHGQGAMTDKAGRFAASGVLEPGEYLVEVRAEGFVDTGLRPFTPGTREWNVVLERHGALEGSVLVSEGISASRIALVATARAKSADPRAWDRGDTRVLPTGHFLLDQIPPGLVDVRVVLDADEEPLASIEGVVVPEGTSSSDPRLRPIDLRGLVLRQIQVTIEGPEHARVESASVAVRPAGDASAVARRILCVDGQLTLVSRWPAVDIEVRAPGMRVARREAVTTDQRIVMEPGIPITVRLPAEFELPPAPLELSLLLCPVAGYRASFEERLHDEDGGRAHQHYQWWFAQAQAFDARRELTFRAPEPGAYKVDWYLVHRRSLDEGDTRGSVRDRREPPETTILESDAGKVIELAPDPRDFVAGQARVLQAR